MGDLPPFRGAQGLGDAALSSERGVDAAKPNDQVVSGGVRLTRSVGTGIEGLSDKVVYETGCASRFAPQQVVCSLRSGLMCAGFTGKGAAAWPIRQGCA